MISKHLYNRIGHLTWFLPLLTLVVAMYSCDLNKLPENYYTFNGETVASYLKNDKEGRFTDFVKILEKGKKMDLLSTYGEYTCFAPTNKAIKSYLDSIKLPSVDSMSVQMCDTFARTHLVTGAFYTTDLVEGALPNVNMDNRYLTLSYAIDTLTSGLVYKINKVSNIISRDDSVTNGVIQVIDHVVVSNNLLLPDFLRTNKEVSLFYEALQVTGLKDSLVRYQDFNYVVKNKNYLVGGTTGFKYHAGNEDEYAYYQPKRFFKFTAFVEPNSVYSRNGIFNLDQLKAYAKRVYDQTFPEDAGKYDTSWTNRKNPLNRFVAYHLIDRLGNYNDWNIGGDLKSNSAVISLADVHDFFETMCPGTVMKISSPAAGLFLNQEGIGTGRGSVLSSDAAVRGAKVTPPSEVHFDQNALNGIIHYVDDIVAYTPIVKERVLNCRFRIDATTTSPDFMNSGTRGRFQTQDPNTIAFWSGSLANWQFKDETFVAVRNRHTFWNSYEGEAMAIKGIYDIRMKLPPVPPGTYELRMNVSAHPARGVVQVYLNGKPLGIPVDMRVAADDPSLGWKADTDDPDENRAIDKSMHNRGCMKGPDSYGRFTSDGLIPYRAQAVTFRRILTTAYMDPTKQEYWLRFRQVLDNKEAEMAADYFELCPKDIYNSPDGEDTH
jgi:uncharacterized surface protein with fasciclin (FAS1) repeats